MTCFNPRDLPGYRRWLRRAADAGDAEAAASLRRFETRLPRDGYWPQKRLDRRRVAMLNR